MISASLIAAITGAAAATSAQTLRHGPGACAPLGAQTLASDRQAVVYSLHGSAYGCVKPDGTAYELGSATICIDATRVAPFGLASNLVAFGAETCGVDFSSSQVEVRSLVSGRTLRRAPATSKTLAEQEGGVQSVVVRRDRSVAWIAVEQSLGNHQHLLQVREDDKRGDSLLDSSLAVVPSSLRLRGSRLTWRDGGKTRSATLR
jgi:hypothetical protein